MIVVEKTNNTKIDKITRIMSVFSFATLPSTTSRMILQ